MTRTEDNNLELEAAGLDIDELEYIAIDLIMKLRRKKEDIKLKMNLRR